MWDVIVHVKIIKKVQINVGAKEPPVIGHINM